MAIMCYTCHLYVSCKHILESNDASDGSPSFEDQLLDGKAQLEVCVAGIHSFCANHWHACCRSHTELPTAVP